MSDLYRRLLEAHAGRGENIPVRPAGAPAPLSLSQERMWSLEQLRDEATRTAQLRRLRIRGRLDVRALHDAFRDLQARHETLRTRLPTRDGHPVQEVVDDVDIALPYDDLTKWSGPEQETRLAALAAEVRRALDVERGPLWRLRLTRLADEEHQLFITLHEAIADGASFGILYRELSAFYAARTRGRDPDLAALAIQYADYATWQRARIDDADFARQVEYWRDRLQGATPVELPARRPVTPRTRPLGSTSARVEPQVAAAIRDLCTKTDATLFMGLLAAFKCVLVRYTGQHDISVGTAVVNRLRRQTRSLIGRFANGLLLRTDLAGDPSFVEVLRRTRETALGAFARPEVPLERIFDVLLPTATSAAPLFNIMFALQGEPGQLHLGDLNIEEVWGGGSSTARNDLALAVTPTADGGMLARIWFDAGLLDPELVAHMANDFVRVLRDAVRDENTSVTAVLAAPAIAALQSAAPATFDLQIDRSDVALRPSQLAALLDEPESAWTAIRRVVCVGEGLTPPLQARFLERRPTCPLYRVYSIEHVTTASIWECRPEPGARAVPIGRMGDGGTCYVLDRAHRPVPPGAAGELLISIRGGAPPGTSGAPDPFRGAGTYMVRTGGRARHRLDGAVEWLGATDAPTRIRGLPIELTDVEAVIAELSVVSQVVVVVRDEQLVAYIVPRDGFDASAARAWIAAQLPAHMVPAAYVTLEALPVTSSGEIAREMLPAPTDEAYANEHYVAPRTPEEVALARLWTEVLGIQQIGIHDDFFALGGHSLLAIRLLLEIERRFGVKVSLRDLFANATLGGLVARVDQARANERAVARPTLYASATRRTRLPPALRGVFKFNKLAASDPLARHMWSVWIDGSLDVLPLERALAAMRERHALLRTRFFEDDKRELLEVLDPVDVARFALLERADLSSLSGAELERADAAFHRNVSLRPLDLGGGEVMSVGLSRWSATRHRLTVSLHNIVSDAETMRVYWNELCDLWRAFAAEPDRDPAAILPPASLQYHHLADYLERFRESEAGHATRAFWQARVEGFKPLELPVDFPREEVDARREANAGVLTFRAGSVRRVLPKEDLAAIERIAERERASVMSTLVAAMAGYLSQRTSQRDVAFITRLSHRYLPGLERTLGFLVNPILLRISTEGELAFSELVGRTHAAVTDAFDHGECDLWEFAPYSVFRFCLVYTRNTPAGDGSLALPDGSTATSAPNPGASGESYIGYDLVLWLAHHNDRIVLNLAYNLELFRDASAEALLEGYVNYVAAAVKGPDTP